MRLRLVSVNRFKYEEVRDHLGPHGIDVVPILTRIEEVQSPEIEVIVEDKCLKAFALVGRPLIVEHTALHLEALNGLPGGLSQIFWDKIAPPRICELFGAGGAAAARAVTAVGYCDGKRIRIFQGELEGTLSTAPVGPQDFYWDCVFIPWGGTQTLAEMGPDKTAVSMRAKALDAFVAYLKRGVP